MSSNLDVLPIELKLEILEHLYRSHGSNFTPIMSTGAVWENPPFLPIDGAKPEGEISSEQNTGDGGAPPLMNMRLWVFCGHGVVLTHLRVSKELCSLSTPYAFRDLHIDGSNISILLKLDRDLQAHPTMVLLRKNVQSIRMILSFLRPTPWTFYNKVAELAAFIDHFPIYRLHTIAVYYHHAPSVNVSLSPLTKVICEKLESGRLKQFGLYSSPVLQGFKKSMLPNPTNGGPVRALLHAFLLSTATISSQLERLDLAIERIHADDFELFRTRCTCLRTLNVRRTFRLSRIKHLWKSPPDPSWWWSTSPRLTTLRFVLCERPNAKHMVYLLRFFPALRELAWASCGTRKDPAPFLPNLEDEELGDAKSTVRRRPLELLFLEHALEWELIWMAQIPAYNVTVAHLDESKLLRAMSNSGGDGEGMFTSMKHLQVSPLPTISAVEPPVSGSLDETVLLVSTIAPLVHEGVTLDLLCARRNVRLSRDAEYLTGAACTCCEAPLPQPAAE